MDKKVLQDLPSPGSTKSIPADSRAKPCLRPEEGNKKQLRKAMDKKVLQDNPYRDQRSPSQTNLRILYQEICNYSRVICNRIRN